MVPLLTSGIYPNDTIGRTLLDSSNIVMLEGNKSQVVAWTRLNETGNVTLLNQGCVYFHHSSVFYLSSWFLQGHQRHQFLILPESIH